MLRLILMTMGLLIGTTAAAAPAAPVHEQGGGPRGGQVHEQGGGPRGGQVHEQGGGPRGGQVQSVRG